MTQVQHVITVTYADGSSRNATRTGNNAAWLCNCPRKARLVGFSDAIASKRESLIVAGPTCGARFLVTAPSLKKVPTESTRGLVRWRK